MRNGYQDYSFPPNLDVLFLVFSINWKHLWLMFLLRLIFCATTGPSGQFDSRHPHDPLDISGKLMSKIVFKHI